MPKHSGQPIIPQLIAVNQSVGPLFLELMETAALQTGMVYLITGTPVKTRIKGLTLRQVTAYDRQNIFSRTRSWLSFFWGAAQEIWKVDARVLVLVVSNPPLLPWLALLLNCIRQQPFIVLVYDIYPDILVNQGRLGSKNPLTKLWRYLNRLSYQRAAYVVTLGQYMGSSIGTLMAKNSKNLSIIPTWVDTQRFVPLDKKKNFFAKQYNQEDKFTILYSGNIGYSHDIRILADAAQHLQNSTIFHFLIIGDGPGKTDLVKKVQSAGLTNVTFLPFQSEETLPYSLAVADVAVVSMGRGTEGLMMPSKTYYAMAVGSALVGLSQPPNDLANVIEQYGCGVNVAPDDVEGLVAALRQFQSEPDYLRACRAAARQAAVAHFDRSLNTQRFVDLISSCFNLNQTWQGSQAKN